MQDWWQHAAAIVGLALLCAGWVLVQTWLRRLDPNARHVERGGDGGCGGGGSCGGGGCGTKRRCSTRPDAAR